MVQKNNPARGRCRRVERGASGSNLTTIVRWSRQFQADPEAAMQIDCGNSLALMLCEEALGGSGAESAFRRDHFLTKLTELPGRGHPPTRFAALAGQGNW
jgi:hypothetical protein